MKSFKYAVALLSIVILVPCTAALAAESITVTSFGGAFSQSQIEAYQKPFSAKTGIKVNAEVYNGGLAELRAQVQAGNVTWDVVDLEKQDVTAACDEGLLEPIDWSTLPPAPDGTPAERILSPAPCMNAALQPLSGRPLLPMTIPNSRKRSQRNWPIFLILKNFRGCAASANARSWPLNLH